MNQDQKLVLVFVLMCIAGLAFWILNFVQGTANDMMQGVGVEILGAIFTAGGVIGLERIFAQPDPQVNELLKKVDEQNATIETLGKQLSELHAHIMPKPESTDKSGET